MRLIDVDTLKKDLKSVTLSNGTLVNTNAVLHLLEEYPTAYDVDKVVEQLGERSMLSKHIGMVPLKETIEIVKRGAKEQE
jgi:hypothetical protein